jgi:hypothetical protein
MIVTFSPLRSKLAPVAMRVLAWLRSLNPARDKTDPEWWWLLTIQSLIFRNAKWLLNTAMQNPYLLPGEAPPPGCEKRLGMQGLVAYFATLESQPGAQKTNKGHWDEWSYYHKGLGGVLGWYGCKRIGDSPGSCDTFVMSFNQRDIAEFFFPADGSCCRVHWLNNSEGRGNRQVCATMRDMAMVG